MTEIDRTKEWTFEGKRLGYRRHVSPHGHGIVWATVNLDTGEVLATESAYDLGEGKQFTAAASCTPHMLVLPDNIMTEGSGPETPGGLQDLAEETSRIGMIRRATHEGAGLIERGGKMSEPSPFWQNRQAVSNEPEPDGTGNKLEEGK